MQKRDKITDREQQLIFSTDFAENEPGSLLKFNGINVHINEGMDKGRGNRNEDIISRERERTTEQNDKKKKKIQSFVKVMPKLAAACHSTGKEKAFLLF